MNIANNGEVQHFMNTLQMFSEQAGDDEEETVKRYVENEKKKALVRAKQMQRYAHKIIVKRITIEGEHTYMLMIREGNPESGEAKTVVLEPLLNAPHHPA